MVIQLLHFVVDRQDQKQRQRRKDDHKYHARRRKLLPALLSRQARIAEKRERLAHHGHDVPPIDDADRNECAQMQQHVKKQMAVLCGRHMKQILQDRQMSGAGDRQKLCDALHQTEQNRIPDGHGYTSQCANSNIL